MREELGRRQGTAVSRYHLRPMSSSLGASLPLHRHGDFVRLWAGQTISVYGSLVTRLALPWLAIGLGARPAQLAWLAAAELVPAFLVGLAAGAWVDRLAKRPMLIACDLIRAALLAVVPAAAIGGWLSLPVLVAVQAASAVATIFFDVAYEAYLPSLVSREQLLEGNSKLTASAAVAEFSAFGSAGWLVARFTAPWAIALDALSFLVSAACVLAIRAREGLGAAWSAEAGPTGPGSSPSGATPATVPAHPDLEPGPLDHPDPAEPAVGRLGWRAFGAEVTEGLRFVAGEASLRALAVAGMLLTFGFRLGGTVWLLFVTRELDVDTGRQGLIYAIGGLSSLAGATVAARVTRGLGLGRALALLLVVAAGGNVLIPLAPSGAALGIALMVAQQLITDPAVTIYEVAAVSLRQRLTPDALLGRMNASLRTLNFAASLAGAAAAGFLGDRISLRLTLLGGAAAVALAGLSLRLSPVYSLRGGDDRS